jgi:hypothetical protein
MGSKTPLVQAVTPWSRVSPPSVNGGQARGPRGCHPPPCSRWVARSGRPRGATVCSRQSPPCRYVCGSCCTATPPVVICPMCRAYGSVRRPTVMPGVRRTPAVTGLPRARGLTARGLHDHLVTWCPTADLALVARPGSVGGPARGLRAPRGARPRRARGALSVNPPRPHRVEPRVKKRRPKRFPLMIKPRHALRQPWVPQARRGSLNAIRVRPHIICTQAHIVDPGLAISSRRLTLVATGWEYDALPYRAQSSLIPSLHHTTLAPNDRAWQLTGSPPMMHARIISCLLPAGIPDVPTHFKFLIRPQLLTRV